MPYYPAGGGAPSAHKTSHENGGSDEIDATGLTGAGGGGGSRDGAKIHVEAAILTQLAGGGYVWDGTDYDDSAYITTYGTHSPQQVDAAAVVFAIPADGTYRVCGMLLDGGSTGGFQDDALIRVVSDRTLSSYAYLIAQGKFGFARGATGNMLGTPFCWEGELTAASDAFVSLWTALAATDDKIARGSWLSILRIA